MPSKQGCRLHWRLSNLGHPNADLDKLVQSHLLNHTVQVLLPVDSAGANSQAVVDSQLLAMLPPDEGYQVIRASLADILAQVLNTSIVMQEGASVQALSLADRIESNHAVAITPDGMLHLAVSSEVYSRLGLTGTHSPSNRDRYNVSLDLKAKSMQPGQERYAQVLAKLRTCFPPQAFLARLEVGGRLRQLGLPREVLTPAYGLESWMPLEAESRTQPGLLLPPLARDTFERLGAVEAGAQSAAAAGLGPSGGGDGGTALEGEEEEEVGPSRNHQRDHHRQQQQQQQGRDRQPDWQLRQVISGLHTWLGALACGLGPATCNELLPVELLPPHWEDAPQAVQEEEEQRLTGTLVSRSWRGMLSHSQVRQVLASTIQLLEPQPQLQHQHQQVPQPEQQHQRRVPWAVVNVWGFADTPVAWAGLEHGAAWSGCSSSGGAGESCYSVLLLPGGDYCVFRALGSNEMPLKGARV
ncbi:hypothetical protein Agub_g458 [Astrephomene gubernaculifera]|uniref:Uncharacterized protein n=1 Tax=Astrephomene gubernaculifera TaxID=47775 RepID=A0AAD3DGE4_9CHLO|nr:hypothetical protein Agub_g458 [Astrephomene gubernaculifera]